MVSRRCSRLSCGAFQLPPVHSRQVFPFLYMHEVEMRLGQPVATSSSLSARAERGNVPSVPGFASVPRFSLPVNGAELDQAPPRCTWTAPELALGATEAVIWVSLRPSAEGAAQPYRACPLRYPETRPGDGHLRARPCAQIHLTETSGMK